MKNIIFLAVPTAITLAVLSSCSKDDMENMSMDKNIDYPAAYVVNGESSSVSVIRLSDNSVTETIELMGTGNDMIMWPHHIYSHQNHLTIGVPGADLSAGHAGGMAGMKGKVIVMDAVKGNIIKNFEVPAMNHNAVYSPDGSEIWTTQMSMNGKALVYDANSFALKSSIDVGDDPAEVTFSLDGTKAYVSNGGSASVTVINPATKNVITTLAVGNDPVGAWPASNGKMYVDNETSKTISVINVASNVVEETINLGFTPAYAAYNASKQELWVSDPENGKVHYWGWDSSMSMWMHKGVFDTGAGAHAIAFTPDGSTALITNQLANTVSVANTTTHTVIKSIPVGKKPNGIVLKM
ncbi:MULTISPECIES: YncE family protein [Chryseobacterium]|uniref:YVTN family beta-propeller repeat protein n=1 Tax=Chryseobacterium aquaticum subsp. greenlandense TaxID=345663 RepID=A0A101CHK1_9FLAO|nr:MULTISPECIES: YncE family protein [Chryseobacterium]KNB61172.1 hypothetical protein AC804_11330 [Chryseobacterium sp. Hurlbut01]KUJ56367.1 hypothetical protein AR686_07330 [Chryseobacterium aquaticum subsp. greenlandense]